MTLLQMSYILEVDRCGSMNRAARNLFLSQSALSAAIADVERELGVTIFLRTNFIYLVIVNATYTDCYRLSIGKQFLIIKTQL